MRQREADLAAAQRETAEALARLNSFLDNAGEELRSSTPSCVTMRINSYLAAVNGKPVAEHIGRKLPEVLPDFPRA